MTTSALLDGIPERYYAPEFKIEVEGRELDPTTKGDLLEVKVSMDIDNMTSFDLTVNNWDDARFDFKYSDSTTFDMCNRIHIQLGFEDELTSMVQGQITRLSPRFPESGPPSMGVSGQDSMVILKDRKPGPNDQKIFTDVQDWEIAEIVARRNKLRVEVTKDGPRHPQVVQKNQDEATFLMERARRIDFDVFVKSDPATGEDKLHFTRPSDGRDGSAIRVYQLEWGRNLMHFTPTLTVSGQVSKVTVRGWDPATKQVFTYTAEEKDLPGSSGGGRSGPAAAACIGSERQDVVVDAPVTSEQETRDLATSLLTERAYEFLTGKGRIVGQPQMRPGDNIELTGLGRRFSGRYFVKQVEHSLGSSGYFTDFTVRRLYDGGTT